MSRRRRTITAVDLFLGSLLGITAKQYTPPADGVLHVDHENKEVFAALEKPAVDLRRGDSVTLKVSEA